MDVSEGENLVTMSDGESESLCSESLLKDRDETSSVTTLNGECHEENAINSKNSLTDCVVNSELPKIHVKSTSELVDNAFAEKLKKSEKLNEEKVEKNSPTDSEKNKKTFGFKIRVKSNSKLFDTVNDESSASTSDDNESDQGSHESEEDKKSKKKQKKLQSTKSDGHQEIVELSSSSEEEEGAESDSDSDKSKLTLLNIGKFADL